ncbi:MAG: hypothetical protein ACFFC3_02730 [Candidatus Odinarchaeota archaeon]
MSGKWIGIFPIICVVLLIVSLFLPVMGISIFSSGIIDPAITGNIMPFGGGILDELEPYTATVPEAGDLQNAFFWVGIIFAILFALDALFLFIGGIRVMTGSKELEKARKKWLTGGLSRIISQVVLIIVLLFFVPDLIADYAAGVEITFSIGLGMIMMIVVGGILVFAWILAKIAD